MQQQQEQAPDILPNTSARPTTSTTSSAASNSAPNAAESEASIGATFVPRTSSDRSRASSTTSSSNRSSRPSEGSEDLNFLPPMPAAFNHRLGRHHSSYVSSDDGDASVRSAQSISSAQGLLLRQQSLSLPRGRTASASKARGELPSHKSFDEPRSPAPFAHSLIPAIPSPTSPSALPPTTNELSAAERRDLVKRSRKLQSMLGATLNEDATEKALLGSRNKVARLTLASPTSEVSEASAAGRRSSVGSLRHQRSMSYPPPSPTASTVRRMSSKASMYDMNYASTSATDLSTVAGTGAPADGSVSRSTSGAFTITSPDSSLDAPPTPRDYPATEHWSQTEIYGYRDPVKEARRRRVRKLHAMLGEQVPLEVILEFERAAAMSSSSSAAAQVESLTLPAAPRKHARSSSKLGQAFARLRGQHRPKAAAGGGGSNSWTDSQSSEDEEVLSTPLSCEGVSLPSDAPFNARDKKLMALFGAIPPATLRSSAHPQSERKSVDALSILEESPASSPELNISMANRQSVMSTQSTRAALRRQSLAALQYMAERDPAALAVKLQQLYASEAAAAASALDTEEDKSGDEARTPSDEAMASGSGAHPKPHSRGGSTSSNHPRSSSEQHRNFQRAAKLSKVLGSEVLTRVLEDIEADMLEDPEAGQQDRRALMRLQETLA